MNIGKYIFAQVIDFIPRYQFDKLVKKYKGDWHAKELTCYNQLLQLLFGQITGCDSLRDICICLEAHREILYHLGIQKYVTHSSLSRANENRDYRIYEELGMFLIGIVRPMYCKYSVIRTLPISHFMSTFVGVFSLFCEMGCYAQLPCDLDSDRKVLPVVKNYGYWLCIYPLFGKKLV